MATQAETLSEDEASFLEGTRVEAEKGSADHQLFLGRHYLKKARAGYDPELNGPRAVDWLIRASTNGAKEATGELKGCLEDKIGVNEENIAQVKACLKTSHLAKSIRLAAKRLYDELKPEQTQDATFSKESYVNRVKDFTKEKREKKFLISTANKLKSAEVVEQQDFVDTVSRRMQSGQIDPTEDDVEMAAFNEASFTRKVVKYPGATVTMGIDMVMEFLTTDLVNLLMYLLPIDQLNVLIIFFLFSLLSVTWLFSVCSLTLYYLSFTVMVICTLQVFKNRRKQLEVRAMAAMLRRYCQDVDPLTAEAEFIANSTRPYWTFLISLLVFVPAFCLANKAWVPCSELALVSVLISLLAIVYLSKHDEPIILLSLGFDLLTCLPHLLAGFPEIPVISQLISVLTVPFYSMKVLPGFYLNFSIPAIEYTIVPLLFMRMAYKNNWKGVYSILLPHLIGFFWFQIGVLYFDHSTWLGLARGSMGWFSFVLLMPFITVAGSVYGIYYSIVTFNITSILKVVVTVLLLLTPLLLSVWQGYGYSMGSLSLRGRSLKAKVAVVLIPLLVVGTGVFLFSGGDGEAEDEVTFVPWDFYREMCSRPAWERTNMADAQSACDHFRFMEVNWTGRVESVNITDIENPAESFLENFPEEIANWLRCLYGSPYKEPDPESSSELDRQRWELLSSYGRRCHMKDKRSFTFQLTIAMPGGHDEQHYYAGESSNEHLIPIIASDEFRHVIFQLRRGHTVRVHAVLQKTLGSSRPVLKLERLHCVDCMMTLTEAQSSTVDPLKQVRRALLESISFFTSPVLEYHPPKKRQMGAQ